MFGYTYKCCQLELLSCFMILLEYLTILDKLYVAKKVSNFFYLLLSVRVLTFISPQTTNLELVLNSRLRIDFILLKKTSNIYRLIIYKYCKVHMLIKLHMLPSLENVLNPLPVQFKAVLRGQKGCVFFSGHLNLPATLEIGLLSREKNHNN